MTSTHKPPVHLATWKSIGAAFGLFAGLAAPILGTFFTVITWFADPKWHGLYLHSVATWLFVVTLPLLLVGAHCLDLLDKEKTGATNQEEEL